MPLVLAALLALLGHEESEPRWLLDAAAGLTSCGAPQPQLQPQAQPQAVERRLRVRLRQRWSCS